MKNILLSPLRLGVCLLVLLGCLAPCGAVELFVATDGNDQWSGRLAAPNADRTDGPLLTLSGARDALRKARAAAPGKAEAATVLVRGGVYRLDSPLVFEPVDSGSADAPVVFTAYRDERPVLSGGRTLGGFRQNGALWETVVPGVKEGQGYFRQLFVGGQRRTRAKSPNTGYHHVADLLPGPPDAQGKAIARDKFGFAPGDLKAFARLTDVNVVLMHSWETSIHPVKSVDEAANIVTLAAPLKEWWCLGYWEPSQRYYVENALELLDQPGEWYLNRETGVLSYYPMPGEKLGEVEVVAPRFSELVRFAGNADAGRFVEHIALRGIAFHHADWELSPQGNSSTQAAVETPAAVMADGARNCALQGCEVAHVGGYGVWFRRGCKDCHIERNRLFDLGAGGIRVGEANAAQTDAAESSRTVVDNNHIFDGGHVYAAGIGIWLAQSSGNRISHNDIHDLRYSGMSIGWNWDDAPNRTHHNLVEWNHVHDLGMGVMSDAGLIYCLGASPGSVIRNNVFHDMWPYSQPSLGWGVYLDATCSGYLVENNLVYNTRSGGLMYNNGGHEHVIRNNIFAMSADHALWPFFEKRPNTFEHNIIYWTQGDLLIPWSESTLQERLKAKQSPGVWDENLYWHTGGAEKPRFYGKAFADWQALGLDRHSLLSDPKFVDAKQRDFRLQDDSPALKLGFQRWDIGKAGLYGDAAWASEASHAKCAVKELPPPPPPPQPLTIDDDFEKTGVGRHPAHAQIGGEEQGASAVVSDQRAAAGKHSLKVTDSKTLQPSWQPHFYYEPHFAQGAVRQSFDVWLGEKAEFFTEWRDKTSYPGNVGPSVQFDGAGGVLVGGKKLATIPGQAWVHVEIDCVLGKASPRVFKLTLTTNGASPKVFDNLPISGTDFARLEWLGFSSTAQEDTVFFLDNLKIAQPSDAEETTYLFAYFTGNGEDGLHLAASDDGLKWTKLKDGASYLKPQVGGKLMRDPCLFLGPDGVFQLVWTDNWNGRTIGHASSKDLMHWSPQQVIPVMEHEPKAENCWAPEMAYDAANQQYVIFWATTIQGQFAETLGTGDGNCNHRIYATTTTNFETFTPAKLFFEKGFNVIDATMLKTREGKFCLIVKDERLKPEKKNLRLALSDSVLGPWGEVSQPFTPAWVEGPSALSLGDGYIVYFDCYTKGRYGAMRSRDLKTWEDISAKLSFPKDARHGSVLMVPKKLVGGLY